jgi:hypothetical protein
LLANCKRSDTGPSGINCPRFKPSGIFGQLPNQAQEFLLLWPIASCNEEGSDLNVGDLAT